MLRLTALAMMGFAVVNGGAAPVVSAFSKDASVAFSKPSRAERKQARLEKKRMKRRKMKRKERKEAKREAKADPMGVPLTKKERGKHFLVETNDSMEGSKSSSKNRIKKKSVDSVKVSGKGKKISPYDSQTTEVPGKTISLYDSKTTEVPGKKISPYDSKSSKFYVTPPKSKGKSNNATSIFDSMEGEDSMEVESMKPKKSMKEVKNIQEIDDDVALKFREEEFLRDVADGKKLVLVEVEDGKNFLVGAYDGLYKGSEEMERTDSVKDSAEQVEYSTKHFLVELGDGKHFLVEAYDGSIQEVKHIYELTEEQAMKLRVLNDNYEDEYDGVDYL